MSTAGKSEPSSDQPPDPIYDPDVIFQDALTRLDRMLESKGAMWARYSFGPRVPKSVAAAVGRRLVEHYTAQNWKCHWGPATGMLGPTSEFRFLSLSKGL